MMKERTKLGLSVLEAALLLGLLGDVLLRATPWGLNVFLWTTALVVAAWALARRRRVSFAGEGDWILPSVLLFAAAFAWRDSLTLKSLDALAILLLLALAASRAQGGRVRLAGLTEYVTSAVAAAFNAAFGVFPLLLQDIAWGEIPRTGWTRHLLAVARGLFIAVPLLVVFGALLMAADAIFEGIVQNAFEIDGETVVGHIMLAVVFAWITGGFLRGMLFGAPVALAEQRATVLEALGMDAGINRVVPGNDAARGAAANDATANDATANDATGAAGSSTATNAAASATTSAATDERTASVESDASILSVGSDGVANGTEGAGGARQEGVRSSAFQDERNRQAEDERARAERAEGERALANAPAGLSLGIIEIGTALGLVNLLFIAFVVVQIRYFFGGAEWVVSSTGLTYAEYARRGFFELVWVAGLALPLLLGAHWLLRKDNPAHERIFRVLAGVQIVLLVVIMVSAVRRMRLYQSEYGMTELRLYTTAFMAWLGLVFVWFTATVLRGQRERFACGALAAALCVVGMLHVLNPDRFIVETNVALVQQGRVFDAAYASSLSADAVPSLVAALPSLGTKERGEAARRTLENWSSPAQADWRTWNWSRAEAWRAVHEKRDMLREMHRQQLISALEANPSINTATQQGTRIVNPYVTSGAQAR